MLQAGHEALLDGVAEPTPDELASLRDEVLRLARMVNDLQQLSGAPVLADPHWLHQVITNLLTNALKFTPSGGRVTIVTRQAGPDAVLQVIDSGAGIAADCRIFSTGSGVAGRRPRFPAAGSAWRSQPSWRGRTADG